MTDSEPMATEVLAALVQLVKKGGGWPTKGSVVLTIASQRGGGWWTSEDVAEYVGRAAGTCRRLLQQLEDERVILRDPGLGGEADARRYWVEVNPDWTQWRVAWRVPRRVVRQRVVLLTAEAEKTDLERFIARSFGARYPEVSARLWARDKARREAADAALSRVPWTRDNGPGEGARRAKSGGRGRSGGGSSRVHGRAINGARTGERGSSTGDVHEDLSPVPGPAAPKKERGISINQSHRHAARRAVCARALPGPGRARAAVWGSSADRLDELVAGYGLDELVAACERIEADAFQVPAFLAALEDLLAHGALPDVDEPAATSEVARQVWEDRRRRVDQRIATYEAEGYPAPDELRAERAQVEAALAGYSDHLHDRRAGPEDVLT